MTARSADTSALLELESRLRMHVEHLAGRIGERNIYRPEALHAAAQYIVTQWQAQGYEVATQRYSVSNVPSENIEVTRRGRSRPEQILLIGAHYDSVLGSPGADDNASAVAALLEIGRAIAAAEPERTLRLVAFVNEEPPFFRSGEMGSAIYARAAKARGDDIRFMVSLEMLGYYSDLPGSQSYPPLLRFFYPDRGNFIAMVSNFASRKALRELAAAFRARSDFPLETLAAFEFIPGVAWSDQRSFWAEGFAALMVTDTAFYRNSYYHTRADTPDKLDYRSLARVVDGLTRAFLALANAPQLLGR